LIINELAIFKKSDILVELAVAKKLL